MAEIDFGALYGLQDRVLQAIFSKEINFYLTGGTCLHRFYYPERYSVDLDLFTNENTLFREDARMLQQSLAESNIQYTIAVDSRDFIRVMIEDRLRVDLVNDRVYRTGNIVQASNGVLLDNLLNLCANKICAILGRDEPKDVFDLYTVYRHEPQDWQRILSEANKKCVIDPEMLKLRFNSFPLDLVEHLHVMNRDVLMRFKQDYPKLVREIIK